MIGQVQKPAEEILAMLDGKEKLVLCGGHDRRISPCRENADGSI
jgi:hypothetical protein